MSKQAQLQQTTIGGHTVTIGDGATLKFYSDQHAATIISVSEKEIQVQQDNARRTDTRGMSEMQQYEYSPNPKGPVYTFRLYKKGWACKEAKHLRLGIGYRREYYDYSF